MFLVDRNVLINLKKFFIGFVIFTVNYLKCSIMNFQNFVNCSFTSKHPNQRNIIKPVIYENMSKNSSFLYH